MKVAEKVYSPHIPTFDGLHNAVKAKSFLLLVEAGAKGLTLRELVKAGGFNYDSLGHLLRKWRKWGYITPTDTSARWRTRWKLALRGRQWLNRWILRGELPLERYIKELEDASRQ